MRRTNANKGFLLCCILNLFLNFEWAALAVLLFILHLWLGVPVILSLVGLGIWLLVALLATLLISWGVRSSNTPTPYRENRNPYSAKNADMFKAGNPHGGEKFEMENN